MNQHQENGSAMHSAVTRRTVIIFGVCICVILGFSQIDPIKNAVSGVLDVLSPVLLGILMAYIINPLELFFERVFNRILPKEMNPKKRRSFTKTCAITLSIVCLLAVIVLLMFLIIPEFLQSIMR